MPHMSHATYESCHIWVMPHMSHVTYESCHIWVMSHMSHVTYESCHIWVMPHMSHATYESCHIWVMSHMSHATYESSHTWIPSHMCHGTHGSFTYECIMSQIVAASPQRRAASSPCRAGSGRYSEKSAHYSIYIINLTVKPTFEKFHQWRRPVTSEHRLRMFWKVSSTVIFYSKLSSELTLAKFHSGATHDSWARALP